MDDDWFNFSSNQLRKESDDTIDNTQLIYEMIQVILEQRARQQETDFCLSWRERFGRELKSRQTIPQCFDVSNKRFSFAYQLSNFLKHNIGRHAILSELSLYFFDKNWAKKTRASNLIQQGDLSWCELVIN